MIEKVYKHDFVRNMKALDACMACGYPEKLHANMREAPTEMTSLREIKDKLDELLAILKGNDVWPGLDKRSDNLFVLQATNFAELAESQGKLLARLDAMDAGLHETAMRNHQQLRKELGDEIEKVEVLLLRVLARPPRKASKKARRAVGKVR